MWLGHKLKNSVVALCISAVLVQAMSPFALAGSGFCSDALADLKEPHQKQVDEFQEKLKAAYGELSALLEQVRQRLYPSDNPFIMALSYEHAQEIYKRLATRKDPSGNLMVFKTPEDSDTHFTPAEQLRRELNSHFLAKDIKYKQGLIDLVLTDAQNVLSNPEAKKADLHSVKLALEWSHDYLRRFIKPEEVKDRDGEKVEKKEEQKEEPRKKKKKDQNKKKSPPPDYPELPKEYKPFSKETDKESGGADQEKLVVAKFNGKSEYFKQVNFNTVFRGQAQPFQSTEIPTFSEALGPAQNATHILKYNMGGRRKVTLFSVPGYEFLEPSDPRLKITVDGAGNHYLEVLEPIHQEIELPLRPAQPFAMNPVMVETFLRPIGIAANEWPDKIRIHLLEKEKHADILAQAKAVRDHIAKEYLYSIGPRPETDPMEALKAGAFQCDMAAYIMVSVLRDYYKIPARAVGGFRGKKYTQSNQMESHLVLPGDAHAWVEVFHDGKWQTFDPTPEKKDKKKKNEEEADPDYQPFIPEDAEPEQSDDAQDSDQGQPSQGQGKGGHKRTQKEKMEQATQKRLDELEKEKGKEEKGQKKGKKEKGEKEKDLDEVAKHLEVGSLSLKPDSRRNPLLDRAMRILMRLALWPALDTTENATKLNSLASVIRQMRSPQLMELLNKGLSTFNKKALPFHQALERVRYLIDKQELGATYSELNRVITSLELFGQTLDAQGKIPYPTELLETLYRVRAHFQALNASNAHEVAAVLKFINQLPSQTRALVQEEFQLKTVGLNTPTQNVAHALAQGKLQGPNLISILSPLTDFIMDSKPQPEYIRAKMWEKDPKYIKGRDFLPTERLSDAQKALRLQPQKSAYQNMKEGTLFSAVQKRTIQVPAGKGEADPERVTIVQYDTSGSMDGEPGEFQAGLIAAFVDRASSDMSPRGKHRHKAILMGFSENVHTTIQVTNSAEARDVIRNFKDKLKNTGQGTDIMAALRQAFAAIADAEKRKGEPLASANIILMTDGQADINVDELRQLRAKIDRRTPIQLMFVAINNTNPQLIEFSQESAHAGIGKGFYREFTPEQIHDVIEASKKTPKIGKNEAFYTEKNKTALNPAVYHELEQADMQARQYLGKLTLVRSPQHPQDLHTQLGLVPTPIEDKIQRPVESWISDLRSYIYSQAVFKNKLNRFTVVDDLAQNISFLTGGVRLEDMSGRELEQMKHLMREAVRE